MSPAPRPTCGNCGKPLRKHTEHVVFAAGDEPESMAECRRRFNGDVVSVSYGGADRYLTEQELAELRAKHPRAAEAWPAGAKIREGDDTRPRVIVSAGVWQGGYVAFGGCFCGVNCAAAFGVDSFKSGNRRHKP